MAQRPDDRGTLKETQLDVPMPTMLSWFGTMQMVLLLWAALLIPDITSGVLTSSCGNCAGPTQFALVLRNPILAGVTILSHGAFVTFAGPLPWWSRLMTLSLASIAAAPLVTIWVADRIYFGW